MMLCLLKMLIAELFKLEIRTVPNASIQKTIPRNLEKKTQTNQKNT